MRIGIQTWGSHGDIRPFIALANGLQDAGHQVTLVVTGVHDTNYSQSVTSPELQYSEVASPVIAADADFVEIGKTILKEKNPLTQAKYILSKAFLPAEQAMYDAALQLCQNNDLVIGHYFHYPLRVAAEKSGVPQATIWLVHSSFATVHHPPPGLPALGLWGNKFFWWLLRTMLNKNLIPYVNQLRTREKMRPVGDLLDDVWCSERLNLVAVSPQLCQQQPDWSATIQVCGFFNMPNIDVEGVITDELIEFLASGPAPVYMNFGSMLLPIAAEQREALHLFTQAAQLAGCRAIIQIPLWQQCDTRATDNILYVNAAPHHQVFPRCAAVVHHGGAGTTQSTLLAGVPSIVVAHIAEQEFWGLELSRLGVAPKRLLRRNVTAHKLANLIKHTLQTPAMRDNAQKIAQAMQKENGVQLAVAAVNREFSV